MYFKRGKMKRIFSLIINKCVIRHNQQNSSSISYLPEVVRSGLSIWLINIWRIHTSFFACASIKMRCDVVKYKVPMGELRGFSLSSNLTPSTFGVWIWSIGSLDMITKVRTISSPFLMLFTTIRRSVLLLTRSNFYQLMYCWHIGWFVTEGERYWEENRQQWMDFFWMTFIENGIIWTDFSKPW